MSDHEDMLDKLERIAEEAGMIDEDDDSVNGESVFLRDDSMGVGSSGSFFNESLGSSYMREESVDTEPSSMFVMDDEEWNANRESFDGDSEASDDRPTRQRRGSHNSRRSSFKSTDSAATSHSSRDIAPQDLPPISPSSRRFVSKRRPSVTLGMSSRRTALLGQHASSAERPSYNVMKSFRQPFSHLSTRRPNASRRSNDRGSWKDGRGSDEGNASVITSLGQLGNSDFENVAAAAAVVALGTVGSKRIQYAVDDTVLVYLNILNHTNSVDPPEAFTVAPVNKFGFQPGEGKSHAEQEGPFAFVMATVRRVHFNEDIPYYTVIRADTLAEQRADAAWMEPLTALNGIEAATRAARQTGRSDDTHEPYMREAGGFAACLLDFLGWPVKFLQSTVVPMYHNARAVAKEQVKHVLFGDAPFYCRIRVTGINLLVLCSFIYMFIQVFALAFLPASWDFGVAVLGCVAWGFLALELIFEWLIRPSNYAQLVASDKAYTPSTARHINAFHLICETIALALFIPEFFCLSTRDCGKRIMFSGVDAALRAITGPTSRDSAFGRFCIGLNALRMFGLVRHWKAMWINRTFSDESGPGGQPMLFMNVDQSNFTVPRRAKKRESTIEDEEGRKAESKPPSDEDQGLKKAATIGTALMVVNSHRALILMVAIVVIVPIITTLLGPNKTASNMVDLLQVNNILLAEDNETTCAFLKDTIYTFLDLFAIAQSKIGRNNTYLLWAQLLPVRCDFQNSDGVITTCADDLFDSHVCEVWNMAPEDPSDATSEYFADALDIRVGGVTEYSSTTPSNFSIGTNTTFTVRAILDENHVVSFVNMADFLLLVSMLVLTLFGLAVLRLDTGRLVLGPLQRMLKIVVRYAENPLSDQTAQTKKAKQKKGNADTGDDDSVSDADKESDKELGNYETEQLISAIAKIADLLRKCWGVAGAGIISTNLARTEEGKTVVFNPTVPGKQVYALFGFVTIEGFSDVLRALDRDVMILINDVAKVVHDEVYRWALGNSGQCNKNLGSSFLMVFRIGDFNEVHERKARATDVVFSSEGGTHKVRTMRRRPHRGTHSVGAGRGTLRKRRRDRKLDASTGEILTLASLPGIQTFTDRALIGLLKSFAGLCRDKNVQNWKKDFRLGAGVGLFDVNVMIGMDAGWAVEGAVGSEYKIDATYLSPHVNMASRMMSASKQYGVKLLLSQAVEELLSSNAREKLRHLDTVYVKGSSVAQRVFTYDARHRGVDFFLFARSPEQSDLDAESYSPTIWDTDQDLRAMRQHVSEGFQRKFKEGVRSYLAGEWKAAIFTLQEADDIMITTILEEGYIDYNPDEEIDARIFDRGNTDDEVQRLRNELGDGACKCLINYMERRGGVPPKDWTGVRPLTSK